MIVGNPFIQHLIAEKYAELRAAVILIEILDIQFIPARLPGEVKRRGTLLRGGRTFDGLASGSVFPRNDIDGNVAIELHGLGLDAARIVPDAPMLIGDAGNAEEPIAHRVAPNDGVPSLKFEACQCRGVTLVVNMTRSDCHCSTSPAARCAPS